MHTLVLGLGNLVHADDGVGVHAIARLERHPRVPPGVVLMDGGTQGLNLLAHLTGVEKLLVLDAIDAGREPGAIVRLEGDTLQRLPGKPSVHQLGFADLMIALQLIGETPPEVVVLGVQPQSTGWSASLTPPVADALGAFIDLAISELERWSA